jgi:hypothetical protein
MNFWTAIANPISFVVSRGRMLSKSKGQKPNITYDQRSLLFENRHWRVHQHGCTLGEMNKAKTVCSVTITIPCWINPGTSFFDGGKAFSVSKEKRNLVENGPWPHNRSAPRHCRGYHE